MKRQFKFFQIASYRRKPVSRAHTNGIPLHGTCPHHAVAGMTVMGFVILAMLFVAGSLQAKEPELVVPEKECEYLTTYQPSPDTEYQPGVDVHGKPVMEADLTPAVIQPPEKYSFDITVDVARYLGLTVPQGVVGETKIGTITVEKGQAKFNGTPLEGDAEAALKALCTAQKQKKPVK